MSALRSSNSYCAFFWMWLNILRNDGSCSCVIVNFLLIVDERHQLQLFLPLLTKSKKKVVKSIATEHKFNSSIVKCLLDTPLKWKLVKQPCRWAVALARRGTLFHGAVERKYYLLSSDLAIFFQNVRDCVVNSTRTGWLTAAYEFAYTSTWSNL